MAITVMEASILLGIDECMAYRLADKKLLPNKRKNRRGFRYITRPQLEEFVQTPLCWLFIEPVDIPDPELRLLAIAAKERTPGQWHTMKTIASYYGMSKVAVWKWRREMNWLKGQWIRYGKSYYLWSVNIPEPPVRRTISRARYLNKIREAAT